MTTIEMRRNLEVLISEHNAIVTSDEVDMKKLSEKKALIQDGLKNLNEALEADSYVAIKASEKPEYELVKTGYFAGCRVREDRKNGGVYELSDKDMVLSMPRLLEIIGRKEDAHTWKTMLETLTYRLCARAYKDMGLMNTEEAKRNYQKLYKASDEAKAMNGRDPLSNKGIQEILQKCADFACFVPSEGDEALNALKLDERYVKWFLYVAFKEAKGRGASISCPRPGTIGKLIVVAMYTLVNKLDFRMECKQLEA